VATRDIETSLDPTESAHKLSLGEKSAFGPGSAMPEEAPGELVIIRPRGVFSIDIRELWAYRELLVFLTWRDLKIRYKQTLLGVSWAIIQPVLAMVVFSVIFGHFARIPSDNLPYPLFAYAGLLPWTYFASCLAGASASVVGNANLVTKVYFPRLLIPLSAVIGPIVAFLLSFLVLLGMMGWYSIWPGWYVIALPGFLLLSLTTALGVGLWLATLNVRYRDIPFAVPFLTQIWMYASPVVYPVSLIPAKWQWVLALNPMAGVIEGFRWALLGQSAPSLSVIGTSAGTSIVLLLTGVAYFRKGERSFADLI
jgi:lipopolysaccharide transport system permease protein